MAFNSGTLLIHQNTFLGNVFGFADLHIETHIQ